MNKTTWKTIVYWLILFGVVLIWWLVANTTVGAQSPRFLETTSGGASVTLAWDAVPGAEGYRVYYQRSGENYLRFQDAGINSTLRVLGLQRKSTYRFYATAWMNGEESLPSNEVSYRTPNR